MPDFNQEAEFINGLLQQKIIYDPKTAKDIIASQDIDFMPPTIKTTLLSIITGSSTLITEKEQQVKQLLEYGADPSIGDPPPLIVAIAKNLTSIIPLLLAKMENPQNFKSRYSQGSNALYFAVKKNKLEAVEELLKDKRFNTDTSRNMKDLYGQTPLEIACRNKADKIIKLLVGRDLTEEEKIKYHYGQPLIVIEQRVINRQLQKYLNLHQRSPAFKDKAGKPFSFIDEEGQCSGLGFLHQVDTSSYREDEFYAILNLIAEWDPSQNTKLPPLLAKYGSVENVFEQIISSLVVYQTTRNPIKEIDGLSLAHRDRQNQFNLTKSINDPRELIDLLKFKGELNFDQQIEILNLLKSFINTNIDIIIAHQKAGNVHVASLCITDKTELKYYDSNIDYRILPLTSPQDLASLITEFSYKPLCLGKPSDKIDFSFYVHQFIEPKKPNELFSSNLIKPEYSVVGFTPLHYAVFENNKEDIAKILKNDPDTLLKFDFFKKTALHYAFALKRYSCIDEIFSHSSPKELMSFLFKMYASFNEIFKYALENHLDKLDISELIRVESFCTEWFLPNLSSNNINQCDALGKNVLHYAIINKDLALIEQLMPKGASWDSKDKEGKTARTYVEELATGEVKKRITQFMRNKQGERVEVDATPTPTVRTQIEKKPGQPEPVALAPEPERNRGPHQAGAA